MGCATSKVSPMDIQGCSEHLVGVGAVRCWTETTAGPFSQSEECSVAVAELRTRGIRSCEAGGEGGLRVADRRSSL